MSRALLLVSRTQCVATETRLFRLGRREEGYFLTYIYIAVWDVVLPVNRISARFHLGYTHFLLTVEHLYHVTIGHNHVTQVRWAGLTWRCRLLSSTLS